MTMTNSLRAHRVVGRSLAVLLLLLSAAPCFAAIVVEPGKSDYCRVLELADCDALVSFAEQQRFTVQGGQWSNEDNGILPGAIPPLLSQSQPSAPGSTETMVITGLLLDDIHSNCMVLTFKARAAAANVARVGFYWTLLDSTGGEDEDFMLVYNDAGPEPVLRLDARADDSQLVRNEVWAARTSADGYHLRWCLVTGDPGHLDGTLYLDGLSITEFAVTASVTTPTADNRVTDVANADLYQLHRLTIGIELLQLAESGELEPVASGFDLQLLSESDLVYQSTTSRLVQSFAVDANGIAEKTLDLWLPQAQVPRSQKLLLSVPTGVLRDDISLQIPAADPDADGLALNRACSILADTGGGTSLCAQSRLLLPGNGVGAWQQLVTTVTTGTFLVSPLVREGDQPSCTRLGITGLQYERGTFIRFRMDSTAQPNSILDFYVGDATEPSGRLLGPDFGVPISHLLNVSGELLLRFCFSVSAGTGHTAALVELSDRGWSPAEPLAAVDGRALCTAVLDLDENACAELQSLRYVDGSSAAAVRPQVFSNALRSSRTASIRNDASGRSVGDTVAEPANIDNFAIFDNREALEVDGLSYVLANVAEGSASSLYLPLTDGESNCLSLNFAPVSYQTVLRFRWALQPLAADEQVVEVYTNYNPQTVPLVGPARDPAELWFRSAPQSPADQMVFSRFDDGVLFPPGSDRGIRICIRGSEGPPPEQSVDSAQTFSCVERPAGQCRHRGLWLDDFSVRRLSYAIDLDPPIWVDGRLFGDFLVDLSAYELDAQGRRTAAFAPKYTVQYTDPDFDPSPFGVVILRLRRQGGVIGSTFPLLNGQRSDSITYVGLGNRPSLDPQGQGHLLELAAVRTAAVPALGEDAQTHYLARRRLWVLPANVSGEEYVRLFCLAANIAIGEGEDCSRLTAPDPDAEAFSGEAIGQSLWGPNVASSVEQLDAWRSGSAGTLSDGPSCFSVRANLSIGGNILRFGWQQVNTTDDRLEFRIDGLLQNLKPAVAGWQRESFAFEDSANRLLQWCYIVVGTRDGSGYVQLNALSFAGTVQQLRPVATRLDYCRVLDLATDSLRCDAVLRLAELPGFDAQGGQLADAVPIEDTGLTAAGSATSLFISAAALEPGQSNCLRLEFAAGELANIARVRFSAAVAGGQLLVYSDEGTAPVLRLDAADGALRLHRSEIWAQRSPADSYRLRWCYVAGSSGGPAADGWLDQLVLDEFLLHASVATPTVVNRVMAGAAHQQHKLAIRVQLSQLAAGGGLQPVVEGFELSVKSEFDLVYQLGASGLEPLDQLLAVGADGIAETSPTMWLPQAHRPREQKLLLFSAAAEEGSDFRGRAPAASVVLPIAAADPSAAALSLNRACLALGSAGGENSICDEARLVLPGNGLGSWAAASSTLFSDTPDTGGEVCLRLGAAGPYSGRGTLLRFRGRAAAASDGLSLYVGAATEPLAQLMSSAEYVALGRLVNVSGELQLLRWCYSAGGGGSGGAELDWLSVEALSPAAVTALDTPSFCTLLDIDSGSCAQLQSVRYADGSETPAVQLQVFSNALDSSGTASIRNDANGRSEDDRAADPSNRDNFVLFDNRSALIADGRAYGLLEFFAGEGLSPHSLHVPLTAGELNCLTLNFAAVDHYTALSFHWALTPTAQAEQFMQVHTRYANSDVYRVEPHREPTGLWSLEQALEKVEEQLRFSRAPRVVLFPAGVARSVRICVRGSDIAPPDQALSGAVDFPCVEQVPGQCRQRGLWLDNFSFTRTAYTVNFEPPILIGSGTKQLTLRYGGNELNAGQVGDASKGTVALRFTPGAAVGEAFGSGLEERLNALVAVGGFQLFGNARAVNGIISEEIVSNAAVGARPQYLELALTTVGGRTRASDYAAKKRLWLLPERFDGEAFIEMFCTAANVGDGSGADCDFLAAAAPTTIAATEVGQSLWGPNLLSSVEHLDAWRSARTLSDGRSCFELRAYMGPGTDILRFGWQQVNTVDDRLEFSVDGVPMELKPAVAGWQRENLDLGARGVRVLQWCYLAVGGHDPGGYAQLNALSLGTAQQPELPTVPVPADYCQVLDIAADAQRCAAVLQTARLQRLAADGTELTEPTPVLPLQRDMLLREGMSPASLFIVARVLAGGQSQCLSLEFPTTATATVARLAFSWAVDAGSDGALMFYLGDSAEPMAVLGADDVQQSLVPAEYWMQRPENGPYRLRWCYRAGSSGDGLGGWLDAVSVEQYRHSVTISPPTAVNRRVEETVHRVHELEFRVALKPLVFATELLDPLSGLSLTLRNDSRRVLIMRGNSLVPLELQLDTGSDGLATSTVAVWLPQSRYSRSESFGLFSVAGSRFADAVIELSALIEADGEALLLNRLCAALVGAKGEPSICRGPELLLPADGDIGGWSAASTRLVSVADENGMNRCLRLSLPGPHAASSGSFVRFRWRVTGPVGAGLRFYRGEQREPLAELLVADGAAEFVADSRLLQLAPTDELLRWCYEGGDSGNGELEWLSIMALSPTEISELDYAGLCAVLEIDETACAGLRRVRYVDGSEAPGVQLQVFSNDRGPVALQSILNDDNGRSIGDMGADPSNRNNFAVFDNETVLMPGSGSYSLSEVARGSSSSLYLPLTEGELNCLTLNFAAVAYGTRLSFLWALQPIDAFDQYAQVAAHYDDRAGHRVGPHRDPIIPWDRRNPSFGDQMKFLPLRNSVLFAPAVDRSVRICVRGGDVPPPAQQPANSPAFSCVEQFSGQCRHRGLWLDNFRFERQLYTLDFEPPLLVGSDLTTVTVSISGHVLDAAGDLSGPYAEDFQLRFTPGSEVSAAFGTELVAGLNALEAVYTVGDSSFADGRRSEQVVTAFASVGRVYHTELAVVQLGSVFGVGDDRRHYLARKRLWLLPERLGGESLVEMFCTAANVGDGDCSRLLAMSGTTVAGTEIGQILWGPNLDSSVMHLDAWRSAVTLVGGRSCFELRADMGPGGNVLRFGWQQVNTTDDRLEFRIDGALMELKPAVVAGWQRESFSFSDYAERRLQWCYTATGEQDRGAYVELNALSFSRNFQRSQAEFDRADYCRVLELADSADQCDSVLNSAELQRFDVGGEQLAGPVPELQEDTLLTAAGSTTSLFISGAALESGQASCLTMEFVSAAAEANIARFRFSWAITNRAENRLLVYTDGGSVPALRLDGTADKLRLRRAEVWALRSPAGNYRLRWCYVAGSSAPRSADGWLDALVMDEFSVNISVSTPTTVNRVVDKNTAHRVHELEFSVVLRDLSFGAELPATEATLTLRSDSRQLYTMRGNRLVPLELELRIGLDGVATTTIGVWLPQSRLAREQSISLFLATDLPIASIMLQLPATTDLDGAELALNRFCASLLSDTDTSSCLRLILPAVGIGEWMFVEDTTRSLRIEAPPPGSDSCLSLLIDPGGESAGTRLGFRWQVANENGARLAFYVGESVPASGYAPIDGEPSQVAVLLPPSTDAQLLRWCPEGSEGTAGGAVFRPLVLEPIADTVELEQALSIELLIRLRAFSAECAVAGEASAPCLVSGERPEALADRPPLADIPADRLDQTWLQFDRLRTSGELDIDRSGNYDQRDLRLILRYLAGLRGDALGEGLADEAGLRKLLIP